MAERRRRGKISVLTGSVTIGTSGPFDAEGNGLQRLEHASSKGIGRGRSICEYVEIMQILPGSSDDALLINASPAFCNMRPRAPRAQN
jgi:hypothetical protein